MDDFRKAFPARLRVLREYLGYDIPTFAGRVGLSPRTIRAHESNTGPKVRTGTLMAICDATGCSLDWLITGRIGCERPRDDTLPKFSRRPCRIETTERAAEWIKQADAANINPTVAIGSDGRRWLYRNEVDVLEDIAPARPTEQRFKMEIVEALFAAGRIDGHSTA